MSGVKLAGIKNMLHQNRRDDAADITVNATGSLDKDGAVVAPICGIAMDKLYEVVQNKILDPRAFFLTTCCQ